MKKGMKIVVFLVIGCVPILYSVSRNYVMLFFINALTTNSCRTLYAYDKCHKNSSQKKFHRYTKRKKTLNTVDPLQMSWERELWKQITASPFEMIEEHCELRQITLVAHTIIYCIAPILRFRLFQTLHFPKLNRQRINSSENIALSC